MGGKLGKQHTYVVSGACGGDTTKQVIEPKRRESLHDSIGSGSHLWKIGQKPEIIFWADTFLLSQNLHKTLWWTGLDFNSQPTFEAGTGCLVSVLLNFEIY